MSMRPDIYIWVSYEPDPGEEPASVAPDMTRLNWIMAWDGIWRRPGGKAFRTKAEAVDAGRSLAAKADRNGRLAELRIYRRNGTLESKTLIGDEEY